MRVEQSIPQKGMTKNGLTLYAVKFVKKNMGDPDYLATVTFSSWYNNLHHMYYNHPEVIGLHIHDLGLLRF